MPEKNLRKPRVDAERNRERLLTTAKATFARKGDAASLEEIAREAGVGIGTLYRHFPTRDALVAAVYRNETEQLAIAAQSLSATLAPVEALRAWMLLFVDYMSTKQGMLSVLDSIVGGTTELYADTTEQMTSTMNLLAQRAIESGDVKLDIEPIDLLRAVAGLGKGNPSANWVAGAKQLVDILIAGIRVRKVEGHARNEPAKPRSGRAPAKRR